MCGTVRFLQITEDKIGRTKAKKGRKAGMLSYPTNASSSTTLFCPLCAFLSVIISFSSRFLFFHQLVVFDTALFCFLLSHRFSKSLNYFFNIEREMKQKILNIFGFQASIFSLSLKASCWTPAVSTRLITETSLGVLPIHCSRDIQPDFSASTLMMTI
jgi:hypothetical protein